MATPLAVANAYANIARLGADIPRSAAPAAGIGTPPSDTSFTSVLKQAVNSIEEIGHKSDAATHAVVNGKSNIVEVATAVAQTEVAIDAVVAVRDKVIAAYEDIMKMPI
jgi:flagellar hook-basal body complex protein FliE